MFLYWTLNVLNLEEVILFKSTWVSLDNTPKSCIERIGYRQCHEFPNNFCLSVFVFVVGVFHAEHVFNQLKSFNTI